jgi:carbonic anhydrase
MSCCLRRRFRLLTLMWVGCLAWPGLVSAATSGPTDLPIHREKKSHAAVKAAEPSLKLVTSQPTAEAPVDPLDRLRQRLAERLSGARTSGDQASNDLRVVVKTPSPPPPSSASLASKRKAPKVAHPANHSATHSATHSAAAHAATSALGAAAAHTGSAHWAYQGDGGPQAWSQLRPEFSACGSGQRQSPIDIRGGLAVELEPVRFDYQPSRFAVIDNGHTVQVNLQSGNAIEVSGKRFELVQFHFHRPSEERIDGKQFEMSLHLVHKDEQGRLAVVALLFDKGARQPVLQKVWNNLPLEKNQEAAARAPLELLDLLPEDRRYFTYMGSLTTPPCSEGVQWIVMRQPVTAAPEQIELFSRIYPMNARPVQSASGRRIMQSQ